MALLGGKWHGPQLQAPGQGNPRAGHGPRPPARRLVAARHVGRRSDAQAASTAAPTSSLDAGSSDKATSSNSEWQDVLLRAMLQGDGFAELTIRAKAANAQPWHTITVRPVTLRGKQHMQVTTFTARQSNSQNHSLGDDDASCRVALEQLLAQPGVGSIQLRSMSQDINVQVTKRGKAILHRAAPSVERRPVSMAHDKPKDMPISPDTPHPFLQRIGLQTADGRVRASMQSKFSQVNDFLKLMGHTGALQHMAAARAAAAGPSSSPCLHVLDCGCGSSHLTFGTWHYLNNVLGIPASLSGVDTNAQLMARSNELAKELGVDGAAFYTEPISTHRPPTPPDIVLALHACDTATDEALALAVKQSSPLILAVPCCHQHLQRQLAGRAPSSFPPFQPLLRHGILKQRALDLVTDSLRAELLRVAGYKTDVVEFVSTEHTPRNLLIRAVKLPTTGGAKPPPAAAALGATGTAPEGAGSAGDTDEEDAARPPGRRSLAGSSDNSGGGSSSDEDSGSSSGGGDGGSSSFSREQLHAAADYLELRAYWGVVPHLEVLLADQVGPLLQLAAREDGGAA